MPEDILNTNDHSILLTFVITGNMTQRGSIVWKFNTSLLHDYVYAKEIKNIVKHSRNKYQYLEDKWIIMMKSDMRSLTILYTSQKKKNDNIKLEI